jgi:predicted aminopeptidase
LINLAKISWNVLLLAIVWLCSYNYTTTIYVGWQATGQMKVLWKRETIEDYKKHATLSKQELYNLDLIARLKKYSVDSLGYKPTANFTMIYDQGNSPVLWAITASEKYKIAPYYWTFPVVGKVSYKGFFDKKKAIVEKNRLVASGYDVDMRSVTAWSTLGWFSDPVLSHMLKRSKGSLSNLIFHELFHATYYAQSSVDFNENLASFIAHKATIQYLRSDTAELNNYIRSNQEIIKIDELTEQHLKTLTAFYDSIRGDSENKKLILKLSRLNSFATEMKTNFPSRRGENIAKQILSSKNAWYIDFKQYNGLQDSLEDVFNKIYKGNLRKMVQSLK